MTTPTPMTDDIITKDEAIARMAKGEKVETRVNGTGDHCWHPITTWQIFDNPAGIQFRKPPEPRRVAREGWVSLLKNGEINICCFPGGPIPEWAKDHPTIEFIRVREVLPGDVVLQRMTRNEARAKLREWGVSNNDAAGGAMTTLIELGLIGEGS